MDALTALPRERKLAIAAGGLVVYVIALLALDWFGSLKATDIDSWWIALVLAVVAAIYYLAELFGAAVPVAELTSSVALLASGLVCFWTVTHFLDGGDYRVGAWVGLIASAVALVGGWLVDRRP